METPKENPVEASNRNQGVFTKEQLRKKFRLSEFLAEKLVSSIAFFSITFIILIFIFVFREAYPLFDTSKAASIEKAKSELSLKPEGEPAAASSPEVYQPDAAVDESQTQGGSLRPETYSPEDGEGAESEPAASEKPERYGVEYTADEALVTSEAPEASQPVFDEEALRHYENKQALQTLNSTTWQPVSEKPRYGLWPLLLGTLKVTLIAILFAAPLAIFAALYTVTFAPTWLREIIKPAIEILAGFPSVVIGFFAMMILASVFQDLFGYSSRLNAFVGGIAMALAAIPIIFTITEDSLSSVPTTFSEASLALGASKWQTAFNVVLPAATPGIFASLLLGIGRVFGETMIALMATGNASLMGLNPFDSVRTLSATIGAEMAEVVYGDTHYSVLFLIGALLFAFTFILNSFAEFYIRGRLMQRIMGRTS